MCCDKLTTVLLSNNFDQILENSSKSHMKSGVFLHVFNDISIYAYIFSEYFLTSLVI